MKTRFLAIAALAVGLTYSAARAYQGEAVADGGKITGIVKFQGTAPKPKPIEITKDKEVCGLTPKVDESLLVGADGGLKDAVVMITSISKGKPFGDKKPVLEQKGCQYIPHVLLTPPAATIDITNDDGILHNIHTYSKKNPPVNRAQPKFKKVIQEKFDQAEIFEVRCDAHGWMEGWVAVQENPYYAVTDASGKYELTDVPPGNYEVKVWHSDLPEKTEKVTVPAKGEAKADFTLASK